MQQEGEALRFSIGTNPILRGPLRHWHYDSFRAELGDGRDSPVMVRFGLGADGQVAELWLEGTEGEFGRVR